MAGQSRHIPLETDRLCEECGYLLTGLPPGSRCPECGADADASISGATRHPTEWDAHPSFRTWMRTRSQVWAHPGRFARHMTTRTAANRSRWFAIIQWALATVWFSTAVTLHLNWLERWPRIAQGVPTFLVPVYVAIRLLLPLWIFLAMVIVHRLAVWLTAWEAAYRGLRLPRIAVRRAMHYHAAHYEPVGIVATLLIGAFQWALQHKMLPPSGDLIYISSLSGLVLVAAVYLFCSYWAMMRKLLYANY